MFCFSPVLYISYWPWIVKARQTWHRNRLIEIKGLSLYPFVIINYNWGAFATRKSSKLTALLFLFLPEPFCSSSVSSFFYELLRNKWTWWTILQALRKISFAVILQDMQYLCINGIEGQAVSLRRKKYLFANL